MASTTGAMSQNFLPELTATEEIGSSSLTSSNNSSRAASMDTLDQQHTAGSTEQAGQPDLVKDGHISLESQDASAAQSRQERRSRRHGAASESRASIPE